ncbi:hypothetical protein MRB53_041787 [Persea americana]|nr:hypothetical protein MRB53_041787 [Persea americana]
MLRGPGIEVPDAFRGHTAIAAVRASTSMRAYMTADTAELSKWRGTFDVVSVGQVLHVWDWSGQAAAAQTLVSLAKAKPGSMIIGHQMGSSVPGERPFPSPKQLVHFRHDERTVREFWDEVGERTGSEWEVTTSRFSSEAFKQNKDHWAVKSDPGELFMIAFCATRL